MINMNVFTAICIMTQIRHNLIFIYIYIYVHREGGESWNGGSDPYRLPPSRWGRIRFKGFVLVMASSQSGKIIYTINFEKDINCQQMIYLKKVIGADLSGEKLVQDEFGIYLYLYAFICIYLYLYAFT